MVSGKIKFFRGKNVILEIEGKYKKFEQKGMNILYEFIGMPEINEVDFFNNIQFKYDYIELIVDEKIYDGQILKNTPKFFPSGLVYFKE